MSTAECVVRLESQLGEGPLWVASESALYWVDIGLSKIHRYDTQRGCHSSWFIERTVSALVRRHHGGFLAAIRDGFAELDWKRRTIVPLAHPEEHLPTNRFNDGKVDRWGRFWAGSMDEALTRPSGALYCLHSDRSVERVDSGYTIANGPAFSPDSRTMYHTDSAAKVIYTFDLSVDGKATNKREFLRFVKPQDGAPDGMTTDRDGCLWVAHFGGARVTRFSPSGERLEQILLPAPNVTSCTFGGKDLTDLYITTARILMSDDQLRDFPLAGSLFRFRPKVGGLPSPEFAG